MYFACVFILLAVLLVAAVYFKKRRMSDKSDIESARSTMEDVQVEKPTASMDQLLTVESDAAPLVFSFKSSLEWIDGKVAQYAESMDQPILCGFEHFDPKRFFHQPYMKMISASQFQPMMGDHKLTIKQLLIVLERHFNNVVDDMSEQTLARLFAVVDYRAEIQMSQMQLNLFYDNAFFQISVRFWNLPRWLLRLAPVVAPDGSSLVESVPGHIWPLMEVYWRASNDDILDEFKSIFKMNHFDERFFSESEKNVYLRGREGFDAAVQELASHYRSTQSIKSHGAFQDYLQHGSILCPMSHSLVLLACVECNLPTELTIYEISTALAMLTHKDLATHLDSKLMDYLKAFDLVESVAIDLFTESTACRLWDDEFERLVKFIKLHYTRTNQLHFKKTMLLHAAHRWQHLKEDGRRRMSSIVHFTNVTVKDLEDLSIATDHQFGTDSWLRYMLNSTREDGLQPIPKELKNPDGPHELEDYVVMFDHSQFQPMLGSDELEDAPSFYEIYGEWSAEHPYRTLPVLSLFRLIEFTWIQRNMQMLLRDPRLCILICHGGVLREQWDLVFLVLMFASLEHDMSILESEDVCKLLELVAYVYWNAPSDRKPALISTLNLRGWCPESFGASMTTAIRDDDFFDRNVKASLSVDLSSNEYFQPFLDHIECLPPFYQSAFMFSIGFHEPTLPIHFVLDGIVFLSMPLFCHHLNEFTATALRKADNYHQVMIDVLLDPYVCHYSSERIENIVRFFHIVFENGELLEIDDETAKELVNRWMDGSIDRRHVWMQLDEVISIDLSVLA